MAAPLLSVKLADGNELESAGPVCPRPSRSFQTAGRRATRLRPSHAVEAVIPRGVLSRRGQPLALSLAPWEVLVLEAQPAPSAMAATAAVLWESEHPLDLSVKY